MEMRLIWRWEWSFTKAVYLLNRYLVIVDFVLNCFRSYGERVPGCKPLFQAIAVIYVIGLGLSEYTLAVRVCVVWKMNRIVTTFLASVCVIGFTWALTSFSIVIHSIGLFTFLPSAYPTIQGYRSIYEHTDLVKHIYVEGVLFYVYLLAVDIICVTLQLTFPDGMFLFWIPVRTLRSILAARALLHLREYSKPNTQGVSTTYTTGSAAEEVSSYPILLQPHRIEWPLVHSLFIFIALSIIPFNFDNASRSSSIV
ncbi:hypothetical protein P691DRAFT_40863 [Macrolepiota fuliginosa MF-IS2]|uniref:DUF6533 domain-containing protein n=1 Tax=Macrolepiota fuliginosa MF-IS2 TaxID=1400762 RepID=A0A9P5XQF7_9AGAR|nr:hypothetical protein P691DRAFT_40863 [Macrolepiota fuliginosa MF-IS2]